MVFVKHPMDLSESDKYRSFYETTFNTGFIRLTFPFKQTFDKEE